MRVSKNEYEMLADFRYALRKFLRFSEDAAKDVGLTPQQHQAMLVIKGTKRHGIATIKDLAERLQVRHNSAVGLVDRLVQLQFVERKDDPLDKRRVGVTLTADGANVLERLAYAHKEELRRIAPQLSSIFRRLSEDADQPS